MSETTKPMPWTDEEIVRHYRAAKDKAAIVPILADLNAVTPSRIRQVLRRHGIKTDAGCRKYGKYETVREEKPIECIKETSPRKPKVFVVLEHDGVEYTIADIMRQIKRSQTYVTKRLENVDTVTFGGVEYNILRYKKWGKKCGLCGKITAGAEKS